MEKKKRWIDDSPQTCFQAIKKEDWHKVDCEFKCYKPEYSEGFHEILEKKSEELAKYLDKLEDSITRPFPDRGNGTAV